MKYTFGDSALASERLRIVAQTMEPAARALLGRLDVDPERVRTVLDLGSGPGHTTRLLADVFPNATVTGVDRSTNYVEEGPGTAGSRCRFVAADVGEEPLPGAPADVVYARYLLSHLDDVDAYVARWCRALATGGSLVLEEPESIVSSDPEFAEYERAATALVRAAGGVFYAGPLIAATPTPPGMQRAYDGTAAIDVTAGQAAAMFWRNARAWEPDALTRAGLDADAVQRLASRLQTREGDGTRGLFDWRQRQTVFTRRA